MLPLYKLTEIYKLLERYKTQDQYIECVKNFYFKMSKIDIE